VHDLRRRERGLMCTVVSGLQYGAQRQTRRSMPVRLCDSFERVQANRAALAAEDEAKRLTGLDAGQLDDVQATLKAAFYARRAAA
jgi:hypothetical protein